MVILKYTLILFVLTMIFLTTDFTDFTDFLLRIGGGERIGCADALSGRSGSSVVLLKYT